MDDRNQQFFILKFLRSSSVLQQKDKELRMQVYYPQYHPYTMNIVKDPLSSQCSDKDTNDDSDQEKNIYWQNFQMKLPLKQDINRSNKKLKNELCKNFLRNGSCRYGQKCQFAHGIDQLKKNCNTNSKYKTKKCSSYHNDGVCCYGSRCNFLHHKGEQNKTGIKVKLSELLNQFPELVLVERRRMRFFQSIDQKY